jgi:VIT1/CCC1 family predicted Fe2+/Mn2+ transporter
MENNNNKVPQRVVNKTYRFVAISIVVFLTTSITGALLGRYIDETFAIRPFGSLGILLLFYILSWIVVWQFKRQITADLNKERE